MVGTALAALWLAPASLAQERERSQDSSATQAQQQTLVWTSGNAMSYTTAPETAVAGPATIVYENSEATGNTTGITHNLTFSKTEPGYNHDVDVNITASPSDSQGGRHEVQVNLSPGTYYYFCSLPGHEANGMYGELVVTEGGGGDTTAPQVSADVSGDRDADGNYLGSATVTLAATDSGSGVESVEYEVDDTGFKPYSSPVTVTEPGDHSVQYRATDGAGNVSQTGSVSFTVVEPAPEDTTAPDVSAAVSGDQDANGDYVGAATVTVSATDSESGVASVEYALDGGAWTAYTEPVTVNQSGDHTLQYRATDQAGNTSQAGSVSFTVAEPPPQDTTPPQASATVTGERNADGDYVGAASVTVSATDSGSGVAGIEYSLDGAPYTAYTGPVEVNQPGQHTVTYRATDGAGNVSQTGSVSFTVVDQAPQDTTAPTASASLSGEQSQDGAYRDAVTVTVSATDTESGVAGIEYRLDGGQWDAYTEPVRIEAAGEHTVAYRATDRAGNTSETATVSFEIAPDACPGSDLRDTVIIDGEDTEVDNADRGDGCTINDLIAEDATYKNHGAFVHHVDQVTDRLQADGVITGKEKGRIMRAAARSDIGKG